MSKNWNPKTFTLAEIKQAKDNGLMITKSQSGKDAYEAIITKFHTVDPGDRFYHKHSGRWNKKLAPKNDIKTESGEPEVAKIELTKSGTIKNNKIQCAEDPKNNKAIAPQPTKNIKIPDVKPPESNALIPELKGGFNRGIKPKNKIEIYSIEDVMRCNNPEIVGFLPIFKNGIALS